MNTAAGDLKPGDIVRLLDGTRFQIDTVTHDNDGFVTIRRDTTPHPDCTDKLVIRSTLKMLRIHHNQQKASSQ